MGNHYDYRYTDDASTPEPSTPGWVVGLIAGAAIGGGLALLFAPRQGTYTRRQLAARGQEAGRQLRYAYDSAAGTARRSARRLTEQAQDWREQAQDWRRSQQSDSAFAPTDALPADEDRFTDRSRAMSLRTLGASLAVRLGGRVGGAGSS